MVVPTGLRHWRGRLADHSDDRGDELRHHPQRADLRRHEITHAPSAASSTQQLRMRRGGANPVPVQMWKAYGGVTSLRASQVATSSRRTCLCVHTCSPIARASIRAYMSVTCTQEANQHASSLTHTQAAPVRVGPRCTCVRACVHVRACMHVRACVRACVHPCCYSLLAVCRLAAEGGAERGVTQTWAGGRARRSTHRVRRGA